MSTNPAARLVPAMLTVPGAVASWTEAHTRYGRLPLKRVLDSAIAYARDGFPVTARLSFIAMMRDDLANQREAAGIFLPDGNAPAVGSKLGNPDLAATLEAIASHGWSGFYEGSVAEEMARFARGAGGLFAGADFTNQSASWGTPLTGTYRDVTVFNYAAADPGFQRHRNAQPARAA